MFKVQGKIIDGNRLKVIDMQSDSVSAIGNTASPDYVCTQGKRFIILSSFLYGDKKENLMLVRSSLVRLGCEMQVQQVFSIVTGEMHFACCSQLLS